MLPAEGDTDKSTRRQGFDEIHDLEIGRSLNVGMGGRDRILFNNEDTLAKEVGEDSNAVGFRDEHGDAKGVYDSLDRIFHAETRKAEMGV